MADAHSPMSASPNSPDDATEDPRPDDTSTEEEGEEPSTESEAGATDEEPATSPSDVIATALGALRATLGRPPSDDESSSS